MNYQTSALFFYSGKLFLGVLICLSLTFFGVSAPIFYLLVTGLVLPVIIALRLHALVPRGVIKIPSVSSEWLIYVNGIPVREARNILTNPGGFSIDRIRLFFANAFGAKLCLQVVSVIMLLEQAGKLPAMLMPLVFILFLWLLYGIWRCTSALLSILTQAWLIGTQQSASGSLWYYGYIPWRGKTHAALDMLLALP